MTQDNWISIKKKKPKHMKDVILCNAEHEWIVAGYRRFKEYYNQMESKNSGDCDILPTHWMPFPPLPSPPIKQKGE